MAKRRVLPAEVDGECVFCAIVAGRAERSLLAEDDDAVAFLDVQPAVTGHALVVPRRHVVALTDLTAAEGSAVWELGRRVAAAARAAGLAEGVNLFLADGAAAGQEVWHVHLHVLPRTPGDGLRLDGAFRLMERDVLDGVATRLRASLPLAE
ncbi:HIT domain-containing protein [Actinomycetospora endophytica]|uniref:HIT domain-containing protein n=1 Tax=Actinomycetospora endophytica TaxID=2291215 RepID=A0ABS8PJ12_9PSEU|nr:HIT domain-containing protein [Actinomycetospora endophytica]MCD2196959.1 HIT domain-containing protein [Actinomycetospora endophytica]